jgi:hypothetical protein
MNEWKEGRAAAMAGKEPWHNPYSTPSSQIADFHAWYSGWCNGKQELNKLELAAIEVD